MSPSDHAADAPVTANSGRTRVDEADSAVLSTDELEVIRLKLEADIFRLRAEAADADADLSAHVRAPGAGAGDDEVDLSAQLTGLGQETSLADHAHQILGASEHALRRVSDGSYGTCEGCARPIGKPRLLAFPRASLCLG
ncbi:MAG: TraR/DksA family transcriptional regulator, partial [Nocardioidaceae bacterium]